MQPTDLTYTTKQFLKGVFLEVVKEAVLFPDHVVTTVSAIQDPLLFKFNPQLLFKQLNAAIGTAKGAGGRIPSKVNPALILSSTCPYQEFIKQIDLVLPSPLTGASVIPTCMFTVAISVVDELFFRKFVQQIILKSAVKKIVHPISPRAASYVDSKIYTILRIVLTAVFFTVCGNLSNLFSANSKDDDVIFIMAIFLGVLAEIEGVAFSSGVFAMNSLSNLSPGIFMKC